MPVHLPTIEGSEPLSVLERRITCVNKMFEPKALLTVMAVD